MLILTIALAIFHARAETVEVPARRINPGERGVSCVPGQTCQVMALVPTLGVGLTRVWLAEEVPTIGRELTGRLGVSMAWYRGTWRVDDRGAEERYFRLEDAEPWLHLGVSAVGGVVEAPGGSGLGVAGEIGNRWLAVSAGYDLAVGAPFVGVGVSFVGTAFLPRAAVVLGVGR